MGRVHDAITRTGTDFQRMMVDKEESQAHPVIAGPAGSVEALLARANLGRSQIQQQELGGLRESLARIETAVTDPAGWLAQVQPHGAPDLTGPELRGLLAGRKRLILRRIDLLVNSSKIRKIRHLAARIPDRRTRADIFKELDELLAKDEIIEAEYRRMDADRQAEAAGGPSTGAVSAGGAKILAPGPSSTGGFASVPAGALLLISAAACVLTVYSPWLPGPEVALAAALALGGLGLLGRRWAAARGGRR